MCKDGAPCKTAEAKGNDNAKIANVYFAASDFWVDSFKDILMKMLPKEKEDEEMTDVERKIIQELFNLGTHFYKAACLYADKYWGVKDFPVYKPEDVDQSAMNIVWKKNFHATVLNKYPNIMNTSKGPIEWDIVNRFLKEGLDTHEAADAYLTMVYPGWEKDTGAVQGKTIEPYFKVFPSPEEEEEAIEALKELLGLFGKLRT